ncbi:MAG: glucosidase [Planctomycetota bacterium]|nr:glucosidase [Planctomycetota bacterium]
MNAEAKRLQESADPGHPWRKWGAYVSERHWGTVREDYSPDGSAWDYFPFDHAHLRAYRWSEDGIGGLCDDRQLLCLTLALHNGNDDRLKERFFGLTNAEGNHGEDAKELWWYLDATPTGSYMKMLYKYPQAAFPYQRLRDENRRRTPADPEFELVDTGIFDDDRYFDVFIEQAKSGPEDLLYRVEIVNRGPEPAMIHALPQVFFRNTWSWEEDPKRPGINLGSEPGRLVLEHPELGTMHAALDGDPDLLWCENESNAARLWGSPGSKGPSKDGINEYVVNGDRKAVAPSGPGTKVAAHHRFTIDPGASKVIRVRLSVERHATPFKDFDSVMQERIAEADDFYGTLQDKVLDDDMRLIQRQAWAGMVWCKQYYGYNVKRWLDGDPTQPPPPDSRRTGRNCHWTHLDVHDVITMPDSWEYPWFALWDLAFHAVTFASIDPEFAKHQLSLFTRDRMMHPNGGDPAYEWAFDDANPPVHAWASWRVFKIDAARSGTPDYEFLEQVFHRLLMNFTWWVNRKDAAGNNIFEGGFLGLDNIGIFDRSSRLPGGGTLEQADATSWMAMFSLTMMRIAIELGTRSPVYQDLATKFLEHFLTIAEAMTDMGGGEDGLWNAEDEFYYDQLLLPDGDRIPLRIHSIVGLIPLFAVEVLEPETLAKVPQFNERLEWFFEKRPDLCDLVSRWNVPGRGERRLFSLLRGHRMKCLFRRMLDEQGFLSDHGVRSVSRFHESNPYSVEIDGQRYRIDYEPGESRTTLFGGNSNWRGPVWFPINFLIIEAMQRFHHYYGDDFTIECPTGSGNMVTIRAAARELASRLTSLFMKDVRGHRPFLGTNRTLQEDPHFQGLIQFNEYFDGETGRGCGASHQTGWTGLAAKIIERYYGSGTDGHQQEEAELGLGATGGAGKRGGG